MKIGTTRALRGPNIWSLATVLETMIDLTSHVSLSAHDVDVIRDRVNQLLIGIVTPFRNDGCDEFNHSPRLDGKLSIWAPILGPILGPMLGFGLASFSVSSHAQKCSPREGSANVFLLQ